MGLAGAVTAVETAYYRRTSARCGAHAPHRVVCGGNGSGAVEKSCYIHHHEEKTGAANGVSGVFR